MNKNIIEQYEEQLKHLRAFVTEFSSQLPEELGYLGLSETGATCAFHLNQSRTSEEQENRNKLLTLIGKVFGCSYWTAKLEYYGKAFDWRKTIAEVVVVVYNAQLIDQPEVFPVPQSAFPIQLEDVR